MTTGPEPRIRTDAGFGRRAPGVVTASPPGRDRLDEPVEHGERIERARGALGVVLHRLDRLRAMAQSLDGPVVQVELADAEPGCVGQRVADDLDLVVLGGDLDGARVQI